MDDFHYMMQKNVNALTDAEKVKLANIRNALPKPDANTLMQKVIPKDEMEPYLSGSRNTVGGFVTKASDAKHLKTYDDIYYGLRLDYVNDEGKLVNFVEDGSCGVIRFKSPSSGDLIIPGEDLIQANPYPFTANGFTSGKMGRIGVPEWKFNGFKDIDEGAELWEIYSDGKEVLRAVLKNDLSGNLKFIKK
jgi:hypothetical protein